MSRIITILLSGTIYIEIFKQKSCEFETHSLKKENHGFLFFCLPMVFNKLVLFYLAHPWIDFLKKKPSRKLKKPK
jgi:hypothetical protein